MKQAKLLCWLSKGAFSGELVFATKQYDGEKYLGVTPRHYADPQSVGDGETQGTLSVYLIRNGGDSAIVETPDGEAITVPASSVE